MHILQVNQFEIIEQQKHRMSSQTNQQKRVVSIQFCKNCNTHSWCTHHSQQRYRQLYVKLSKAIESEFPNVVVKGNELPKNFVPIKASENKFFDAMKSKYVFFPAIGAFQVSMDGQIIFSKKAINSWPIFQDIVDQISLKIHGKVRQKPRNQNDNMTQEETIALANSYLSKVQNRKTLHKHGNEAFTLSDHFKLYQKGKHKEGSAKDYYAQIQKINTKKLKRHYQNDQASDNNTIGSNSIAQSRSRVKDIELLKKLESIEQQNFTDELKKLTKGPQQGNIQDWNRYLDHLETKFQKFQQKVTKIEKQNIKMNKISPTLDQTYKCLHKSRNKEENGYSPTKRAQQKLAEKIGEVNQSYKTFLFDKERIKKLANIQAFLNASQKQKNKVLSKIYGFDKKQQPSSIKRRFYKKRKNDFRTSHHPKESDSGQNLITQSEQNSSENDQKSEYSQNSSAMPQGIKFKNNNKLKFPQQKSKSTNSFGKVGVLAKLKNQGQQGKQLRIKQSRCGLKSQQICKRPIQKGNQQFREFKTRIPAQSFENKEIPQKNKKNKIAKQQNILIFERKSPKALNQIKNSTQEHQTIKSKNFRSRKTEQTKLNKYEKRNRHGADKDKSHKGLQQRKQLCNANEQVVDSKYDSKCDKTPKKMSNSRVVFDQENHSPNNMQKSFKQSQNMNFSLSSEEEQFKLMNKYNKQKGLLKQLHYQEKQSQQENQGNQNNQICKPQKRIQPLCQQQKENNNNLHKKQQTSKVNTRNKQKEKMVPAKEHEYQRKCQTACDFGKNIESQSNYEKKAIKTTANKRNSSPEQSNAKNARNSKNIKKQKSEVPQTQKQGTKFLEKNQQLRNLNQKSKQNQKKRKSHQQLNYEQKRDKASSNQKQKTRKQTNEQKVRRSNQSNSKSILKRNSNENLQQQNPVFNRHDTIDENDSNNENQSIRNSNSKSNSKSNNSSDKKVSFDSSEAQIQQNQVEREYKQVEKEFKKSHGSNGRQKAMDSKKTQRRSRQAMKKSINQSDRKLKEQAQQVQLTSSNQQSYRRSTQRYKSEYLQQGNQFKINILSNRNDPGMQSSKNKIINSKRNHKSMINDIKQGNSQRNKSLLSVFSNKDKDESFRNTPDIVRKIYGQRLLTSRNKSVLLVKNNKKGRKSFSERSSSVRYKMKNDHQSQELVKKQSKRNGSVRQSSREKSRQKKDQVSFRNKSHRFSQFKPKMKGTLSQQSGQQQNRSIKSKMSKKSGKSKKPKSKGGKTNKDSLLKTNRSNSLLKPPKSSKKSKNFESQKKIVKKKKSKSKKSLKEYALEQNQNPIDNVGTNRAEKSSRRDKKVKMVSIGIQKDESNEKQIQTENTKYFRTEQVFRETNNQNKQVSLSKYSKQQKSNIFEPEKQGRGDFGQKQIQYSSERALLLKQIYGTQLNEEKLRYVDILNGNVQVDIQNTQHQLQNGQFIWNSISKIQALSKTVLFNKKGIKANLIRSNSQGSSAFRKVVKMLAQRNQFLIIRLFENIEEIQFGFFGVWICDHYRWKCIIVNDLIPVDQQNTPIFSYHENEQIWSSVLQKALAIVLGGYQKLAQTPTNKIFHMLTGSNYINFKVREEYEKNKRFLAFLTQNQKKNFIIHAQKLSNCLQQHELAEKQTRVYYLLGQKTINDGQILLRMKQQNKQPFLIKLQKFACQFKNVEILQLRANHNFTCMKVPETSDQSNLSVFQLVFDEPQFGSIALSNPQDSNLKTYLYREEEQNVLRMVGQARQKHRKQVFFDCFFQQGKYYIFLEADNKDSLVSYFGQGKPHLCLKQKIKQQGLKNNFTEYVPLNETSKLGKQNMPKFMSFNKQNMNQAFGKSYSHFGNSRTGEKQRRGKALQDLRIHFVQFLLGTRN